MKNKTLVIFDGNHLAYRAYYKFPNLKTFDGINTSIVYGIPYIIESIIRRLSPDKAIITIDGGRSSFRESLLPEYKKREQKLGFDKEDFYRQREDAMQIMSTLGINIVWKKGYEADDLIAMICRRYVDAGWDAIIVSGDKDFNQLISDNIQIFNTKNSLLYNKDNLKEKVGYEPSQCVDYLCLTGDTSDKIPGYPGIGKKRGHSFLEKFTSIRFFLQGPEQFGQVDKVKLREIYNRNRKVIDLKYFYRHFLMKEFIPQRSPEAKFSENRLTLLCRKFETNSFLKPQFINTYKKLWNRNIE